MKRKQRTVLLALLFVGGAALSATAQSTSTKDRVDRDVIIFERILEEMFQVEISSDKQDQRTAYILAESNMRTDRSKTVHGSYFEGYGLELHISNPLSRQIVSSVAQNNVTFRYPVNSNARQNSVELNIEGVKLRMVEFLKKYAPLFESIKGDENIVLIYGMQADSRNPETAIFALLRDDRRQTSADLPSVAMWVEMNDITQYKNGRLSEDAFEDRLQFFDLKKSEDKKYQDQTIFSSILKTSIESLERNYFSGSVRSGSYYIPGLGVHYDLSISMQARVQFDNAIFRDSEERRVTVDGVLSGTAELLERFTENLKPIEERIDSSTVNIDSLIKRMATVSDSNRIVIRGFSDQRRVSSEELNEEMELIVNEVKKVIQNYGATLDSLGGDELLSITINWTGRNPNLPSQSRIKITKQDLMSGTPPDVK